MTLPLVDGGFRIYEFTQWCVFSDLNLKGLLCRAVTKDPVLNEAIKVLLLLCIDLKLRKLAPKIVQMVIEHLHVMNQLLLPRLVLVICIKHHRIVRV